MVDWDEPHHETTSRAESRAFSTLIATLTRELAAKKAREIELIGQVDDWVHNAAEIDTALTECRKDRDEARFDANFQAVRKVEAETGHRNALSRATAAEALHSEAVKESERLKRAVEFTAKMAWRTDPPNANNKLTDGERLSCIKHHPTIKRYGESHQELADREAALAATKDAANG